MQLRWDGDSGYLKINETQYQLQQIHWHTPSEHSINGKRYDMEAHLVHMSSDRKTALEGDLKAVADKRGAEKGMGIIDPNIIKLDDNIYYRYIGSLTTPPCTEGLVWTIDGKVNSVTARQIKLLQDAAVNGFEFNARPVQLLNGHDTSDEFSYDQYANNGPAKWGEISSNCNGNLQSPIDLDNKVVEVVSNLGILQKYYKPSNATLVNRGHDIMLRWDGDAGYLKINETQYQLLQIHWHTPSEHSIDEGDLIAVADKKGAEKPMGIIDPNIIKLDVNIYYRYIGSLTTPPCTQGVVWTIDGKVNSVTARQIKLLQDAVVNVRVRI
uniref:Carbonic anhydrase n=1 Tax=Solanum lycopersicum TaxID=4081 RepID=A0A3Q7H3M4_SOLLC